MAPEKYQDKSKGKGPAPKATKCSTLKDSGGEVLDDPVNMAILEHLAQIEDHLRAEGVGQASLLAGASSASFQAQLLAFFFPNQVSSSAVAGRSVWTSGCQCS